MTNLNIRKSYLNEGYQNDDDDQKKENIKEDGGGDFGTMKDDGVRSDDGSESDVDICAEKSLKNENNSNNYQNKIKETVTFCNDLTEIDKNTIQMNENSIADPFPHSKPTNKYRRKSTFVIVPKLPTNSSADNFDIIHEADPNEVDIKLIEDSNLPDFYVQLNFLNHSPDLQSFYWLEKSRWFVFEEEYDLELGRFGEPHLSPLSFKGFTDFKKLFKEGQIHLECDDNKIVEVLQSLYDYIRHCPKKKPTELELDEVHRALISKHYQAGDSINSNDKTQRPSLVARDDDADLHLYCFDKNTQTFYSDGNENDITMSKRKMSLFNRQVRQRKPSKCDLDTRVKWGTEALTVHVGGLEHLQNIYSVFLRLNSPISADNLNEVNCPIRFIYLLLGPKHMEKELIEAGRCISVMISNIHFREILYSGCTKEEIIQGIKQFLNQSILIPLPKIITNDSIFAMNDHIKRYKTQFVNEDSKKAYEQLKNEMEKQDNDENVMLNQVTSEGFNRRVSLHPRVLSLGRLNDLPCVDQLKPHKPRSLDSIKMFCRQFCPPLHQIRCDLYGFLKRYPSDITDAFSMSTLTSLVTAIMFVYIIELSATTLFGALIYSTVSDKITISMSIVSVGCRQILNTILTGQPMEILCISVPVYVIESVIGLLAKQIKMELEIMRFWVGIYVAGLGLIFGFLNGCNIIKHIRRSVEEVFIFFVGISVIVSSLVTMFRMLPRANVTVNNSTITHVAKFQEDIKKFGWGGTTFFFAFLMVNICLILVKLKSGFFFSRQARNLLASLNIPLGIGVIVGLNQLFFTAYDVPTLTVPPSDKVNVTLWWRLPSPYWLYQTSIQEHIICFLSGLSLFAVLTTEISTNLLSVTKSERRLTKPSLFSLNYFLIQSVHPLLSSFLGWPFMSSGIVTSHIHCLALAKWSVQNLPGVPLKVIGTLEQRVSGVASGMLMLLSVFMGSFLGLIPMAAMHGIFIYIGIMTVKNLVLTERLVNLMQRRKHWNILNENLKDFPTWHIMIFVIIQLLFIVILISLQLISTFTEYSWTALMFPFFVCLYALIRGYVLPKWKRLNKHLSKMDRKHKVELYKGKEDEYQEQLVVVMDDEGMRMCVKQHQNGENIDEDEEHIEIDRY